MIVVPQRDSERGKRGLAPPLPAILIGGAMAGLEQVCRFVIPKLKVKGSFVIENRHNTIGNSLFWSNMKEIDDTPLPENESEDLEERVRALIGVVKHLQANAYEAIKRLELRIANLETQRTPQDENDDPEWY